LVHKWRAEEASILVGTRTAEQDDPALTVRDFKGNGILRLVIDRKGKLNPESKVFKGTNPTHVFTDGNISHLNFTENKDGNVRVIPLEFDKNLPEQIANHLFEAEIQSLIVEGGALTLNSFIDAGLWDEARVFRGSARFYQGTEAPKMTKKASEEQEIHGDLLLRFFNGL
jgi:diaminohydroxyphosphoribosylaminopyrimidine deaminase/5-amino-6-(5-phosphoribosylamino)uracil reductase